MARSTFGISPSFLGLSQSSGQVTHVLLTRSRLCPRASPGSSLHLHVLSTPPAFVLSQDQTLREESVMDCPGPIHNGPDHDGVLLFLTRLPRPGQHECARPWVEPGRTPKRPDGRISVRMLLSFQRPSRPCTGVIPGWSRIRAPCWGPDTGRESIAGRRRPVGLCPERGATFATGPEPAGPGRPPARGRPVACAPNAGAPFLAGPEPAGPAVRRAQAATWTATVRSRGRVSKSIRTICCQVPRASFPSTTGIATDGPTIAARAWAWPLVSWLRRLCS